MLPLAFAEFDKAVTQDSIVLFPRVWENFRGDTGRVAKTNETDPFYITWHSDPDKKRTFPDKPVSSANAEESKDTGNDRPDPVLPMADLKLLSEANGLKLKYIELGPFVFKTDHDGSKRVLERKIDPVTGNIYINEKTEDGRANGKGIRVCVTSGARILSEGYWKDGKKTYGRVIYSDGSHYIGNFMKFGPTKLHSKYFKDMQHGKGVFTSASGEVRDGWFVKNRFVGKEKPESF